MNPEPDRPGGRRRRIASVPPTTLPGQAAEGVIPAKETAPDQPGEGSRLSRQDEDTAQADGLHWSSAQASGALATPVRRAAVQKRSDPLLEQRPAQERAEAWGDPGAAEEERRRLEWMRSQRPPHWG